MQLKNFKTSRILQNIQLFLFGPKEICLLKNQANPACVKMLLNWYESEEHKVFPELEQITCKANLAKLKINCVPKSFLYPQELYLWKEENLKNNKHHYWLYKPKFGSNGDDIVLIEDKKTLQHKQDGIITEYISNPWLISGLKFDFRLYVMVCNVNPLNAYLFKNGLVRFSTIEFTMDKNEFTNKYIHLTNYTINSENKNFNDSHKQTVEQILPQLPKNTWKNIENAVRESLGTITLPGSGFHLIGFDLLLDDQEKIWILEVQNQPSLLAVNVHDFEVKLQLMQSILNLLEKKDLENWDLISLGSKIHLEV